MKIDVDVLLILALLFNIYGIVVIIVGFQSKGDYRREICRKENAFPHNIQTIEDQPRHHEELFELVPDISCKGVLYITEPDCANSVQASKFLREVLHVHYDNHNIAGLYFSEGYYVIGSISNATDKNAISNNRLNVLVSYSKKYQDILVTIHAVEFDGNWSYEAMNSFYRNDSGRKSYHDYLHFIIGRKEKFVDTISILTTSQNSVVGQIIANDTLSTLNSFGYRDPPSIRLISFDGIHLCKDDANQMKLLEGIDVFTCKSNETASLPSNLKNITLEEALDNFITESKRPEKYEITTVLSKVNLLFRSDISFPCVQKYWEPTTKEEIPAMQKHIAYGEMIAFVYDTVESNKDSLNYQEDFPLKGYDYVATLRGYPAGSKNSFFGFAAFNVQEMELVFVIRGSMFSNDWAANLDAAASLWNQNHTDDRGPQNIKKFDYSRWAYSHILSNAFCVHFFMIIAKYIFIRNMSYLTIYAIFNLYAILI